MPNDKFFETMDPVQYLWMYESWKQDKYEQMEMLKLHAAIGVAPHNSKYAQSLIDENGGGEIHASTDEEFDRTVNELLANNSESNSKPLRKRQRKLKELNKV